MSDPQIPDWLANIPPPMSAEEYERACAEREQERRRDLAHEFAVSIPEEYAWARFGAALAAERTPGALDQARNALGARRVVLHGKAGAGKTTLGVAMLRAWHVRHGGGTFFAHAYRLGREPIQHRAGAGECELVLRAMKAPLVLLDDLGNETNASTSAVSDVIQARHAERRPLWVTTGLSLAEIGARYGGGVVRRLFEDASVIKLGGRP